MIDTLMNTEEDENERLLGTNDFSLTTERIETAKPVATNEKFGGSSNYSKIDIDEVFRRSGNLGRFQLILLLVMSMLVISIGYHFVLSVFIGDDPPWTCISNRTSDFCAAKHGKRMNKDSDDFYERCQLEKDEWNYTTSKYHSFVTEFDLVCSKTFVAALASSSFYMGGVVGSIVSGAFADRYGRKPVLIVSLFTVICFGIGCSFVKSIIVLAIFRSIIGASQVACFFTGLVFLSEFMPPKYRPLSSNMYIMSLTTSIISIDVAAYFQQNWRLLQLYSSIPSIFIFFLLFALPESPRWLLVIGQKQKAKKLLQNLAHFNGYDLKDDIHLKHPVTNESKCSYLDLFRNKRGALITLAIGTLWAILSILYYTAAFESSSLGGNMYLAFGFITLVDIPCFPVSIYVCNRCGRKKSALITLLVGGMLMGSVALIPKLISFKYIINMILVITAKFCVVLAFSSIYVWTFELFPTVMRMQGTFVCVILERIGLLAVPFLTTILQGFSYVLPFVTVCFLAILGSVLMLCLPETKDQATRETYEDFIAM